MQGQARRAGPRVASKAIWLELWKSAAARAALSTRAALARARPAVSAAVRAAALPTRAALEIRTAPTNRRDALNRYRRTEHRRSARAVLRHLLLISRRQRTRGTAS